MKIIPQKTIFDYMEVEILGDLVRGKYIIENVPDEEIIKKLKEIRGKGRNEYPIVPIWNSILIMPILECSSVEQLRRELSRNSDLRKLCGFHFNVKDLRTTFATMCAENGVQQNVIAKWLGHTNVTTTNKYYLALPSDQQEIIRSLITKIDKKLS